MSLLTASQITKLKTAHESALSESVSIYRRTLSKTSTGGVLSSTPALVATVDCRLLPTNASIAEMAGTTPEVERVNVLVGGDVDAVAADELVIDTERFRVTGVIYRWPHIIKRLECVRL